VDIESLLKLIGTPRDNPMLRLTLARLLADRSDLEQAETHLQMAIEMDGEYTAAWKELGKVRRLNNDVPGAARAWRQGIEVAHARGDKQAEKEMTVFLRRIT
jgi:Tfp pilus assembly protein PilF